MKELVTTAASSRSAMDSMAKALSQSEHDRQNALDCRRKMEGRLNEMMRSNSKLEENNFRLTNQIQQLTMDLEKSREKVDELLKAAQHQNQKEWDEREKMYRAVIRGLKKSVTEKESMISLEVYKAAVLENRRLVDLLQTMQHSSRTSVPQGLSSSAFSNEKTTSKRGHSLQPRELLKVKNSNSSPQLSGNKKKVAQPATKYTETPAKESMDKENRSNGLLSPPIGMCENDLNTLHLSLKTPRGIRDGFSSPKPGSEPRSERSHRRQAFLRSVGGVKGVRNQLHQKRLNAQMKVA